MIEYKQSVAAKLPVRIVDSGGTAVAGVLYSAITATAMKSDGTTSAISVTAPDWVEVTTGAFAGEGFYTLAVSGTVLGTAGLFTYAVTDSTNKVYMGCVKVVANEEVDTYVRVGAPAGVSVSADIASVKSDSSGLRTDYTALRAIGLDNLDAAMTSRASQASLDAVQVDTNDIQTTLATLDFSGISAQLDEIIKYQTGRWKIHVSGDDANRMVIYDEDGTTPLAKFDLFDAAGNATPLNPFERVPVP
jgi:hypothetical protein